MTTMRELGQAELREPPRNIDAEGVVLGGVMMHNGVFDQLSPILERRHFFDDAHKMIWEVISGLIEQGMTANAITCRTYLPEELAENMPTAQYLAHLTVNAVKARDTIEHAKLVRTLWIRRQMIALTQELQASAFDLPVMTPAEKLFSDFEVALDDLRPKDKDQSDFRGVGHGAREAIQIAAQAYQRNGGIGGESTGLPSLDDIMGGLNKSDLIILAGRPGMGKSQNVDAVVYTPSGPRRIGDLRVGDRVLGADGLPATVLGVYPQGVKPAFRVIMNDGSSTTCNSEHLWAAKTEKDRLKRRDWRVVTLAEIMAHGLETLRPCGKITRKWSVPLAKPAEFDRNGALPIPPYTLGVLIGDGALTEGLTFAIPDMDVDISSRVQNEVAALGYSLTRTPPSNGHNNCPRYRITLGGRSNGLWASLRSLDLDVKSPARFIPDTYKFAPAADRLALLHGLMDTDGSTYGKNRSTFSTHSDRLARDMAWLVRSLGGISRVESRRRGDAREFTVSVVLPSCPFSTSRKAARWSPPSSAKMKKSIVAIEPAGDCEQVCIQVSAPDSLYLTDDFIVTHNTALATNIAVTVARRQQALRAAGQPSGVVAFNSLEMSAPQLAARIMSEISGVPSFRVKRGQVSEAEFHAFADAERELDKLPLEIDDTGGMNIAQLRNRARNLKKRKGGLALLVVDYLQLLAGSGKSRDGNRVQEVTEITVGLKALAKELDIPILALSQLSRKVEERDDKRPKLSDLRESGSIEQDADQVIFVFRDEYYLKGAEPPHEHQERHQEWARLMHYAKGVAEIIVAKNRHGPDGVAKVGFDAIHTRFKNEADEREEMAKPEKAKRETEIKFTAEAAVLFGALKSLSRTRYNLPTPEILHANRKLPKKARLIKMEDARMGFKAEAMPEADDADVAKRFTNTFKMLRSKEAAFYVGNDSTGYHVWLPSMVDAD